MKKVEAIVQSEVSKQVVNVIRKIGIEGATLIQSLGQGEGERPEIGGQQKEVRFSHLNSMINIKL